MDLVSIKGVFLKYEHEKEKVPYPCHPVIPDTEWTRQRWGRMTETAMERWKTPGVTLRLLEEGDAAGTYKVMIEQKKKGSESQEEEETQ